ncbi:MAG: Rha family transcriptional regulator [Prevotella sp.]|nr:Rha family transcriptional regulator [Alistipes senegalensis]MCM1357004.1 Rha family transcriptional regulator [Prevotella sp.]MCM1472625.1 Rha family transcriptional regulator [Muribaculaceae bacterium]
MNEITISKNNGELTVSSLQVAKDFEKQHKHVLEAIESIKAENSAVTKMFIESTYKAGTGKSYKCYEITRDGFSLLVMGFTGKQALEWKLKYIEAFNLMETHIKENNPIQTIDKAKALEVKEMNARVRMSNQLLKLAKVDTLSPEYKNILVAKSAEVLTGQALLPLPKSEQKTYSAGEVGEMFGVSAQKIGHIAKANNMKTDEYGSWYHDKSPYSNKEVDTFRYNDRAIEKFREIFK